MTESSRKQCLVVYATAQQQYLWQVDLPHDGTIGDAIQAARRIAGLPDLPWDSARVGIFGEPRERSERAAEGDRIEIYRPLHCDPRERRRERVRQLRKAGSR